jgi:hypothetical protein
MLGVKDQQRVNVKFLANLGEFATEIYSLLMEVYDDECLVLKFSMLMEVYGDECLVLKFSSGSKDLKGEGERSKSKSNFKAMMIVFLISEGLFTLIGCLKVRPLPRSAIRRF